MGSGQPCALPEGKVQAEDAHGVLERDMEVGGPCALPERKCRV